MLALTNFVVKDFFRFFLTNLQSRCGHRTGRCPGPLSHALPSGLQPHRTRLLPTKSVPQRDASPHLRAGVRPHRGRTLLPKHRGGGYTSKILCEAQNELGELFTPIAPKHPLVTRLSAGKVSPCPRFTSLPHKCLLNYIGQIFHRAGLAEHPRHLKPRPRSRA